VIFTRPKKRVIVVIVLRLVELRFVSVSLTVVHLLAVECPPVARRVFRF
jgi:hypothetical protein